MKCLEFKGRVRDVVWVGRVALAVVLLPLMVPLVLLGPAEHVVREWFHQRSPTERPKPVR